MINEDFHTRIKAPCDKLEAAIDGVSPIVWRSLFPRSIVGKYQDDPVMRSILMAGGRRPLSQLSQIEIVELIGEMTAPLSKRLGKFSALSFVHSYFESFSGSASEFFKQIAERLKHLETYQPTARDFALEELQNAYVGLARPGYWPTKGEVIEMAKARLRGHKKKNNFSKTYWSELLKAAELNDELPEGKAGRPSKTSLDENVKAERECKAILTQTVREDGGDWINYRDRMKAALGNKAEFRRGEQDRLRASRPDSEE
jgi:hypothetical protein